MKTLKRRLYVIVESRDKSGVGGEILTSDGAGRGVLAFESRSKAFKTAAELFGYDTYAECRKEGWCEVVEIVNP